MSTTTPSTSTSAPKSRNQGDVLQELRQHRVLMQRELHTHVRSLQLTVLLVTHDLNEAIALSDRIVLFSRRPASILEVYPLSRREPDAIDGRGLRDEGVYAAVWERLSRELDPRDAAAG